MISVSGKYHFSRLVLKIIPRSVGREYIIPWASPMGEIFRPFRAVGFNCEWLVAKP